MAVVLFTVIVSSEGVENQTSTTVESINQNNLYGGQLDKLLLKLQTHVGFDIQMPFLGINGTYTRLFIVHFYKQPRIGSNCPLIRDN